MNNIQQCRVQLEKVYEAMGGDQSLKEDTKVVMHDLQQMLNDAIDEMAEKYSAALRSPVLNKVNEVNKILHQVSSPNATTLLALEKNIQEDNQRSVYFRYRPTPRPTLNPKLIWSFGL